VVQLVESVKFLHLDMGVALGGPQVGVAEEFLDTAQVAAAGKEMSGAGMPQDMGMDFSVYSGGGGKFTDQSEYRGAVQALA